MDFSELKKLYKKTFDSVSEGYGHAAMRFFEESAEQICLTLKVKGDEHILDVATGTGYAALTLAKQLPDGHVTGIDFSTGMLKQAMINQDKAALCNVTFAEMDMQNLEFRNSQFDIAVSAFSIFFVEDMTKQLIHIADKVRDGGTILTTSFNERSFAPLIDLFVNRLRLYDIHVPNFAWKNVASEEQCITLFQKAGLQELSCDQQECGYYLTDASDWWYIIWNGGFRGLVNQLSEDDHIKFQEEHLAEVQALATEKGIWIEMGILYTHGKNMN